MEPRCVRATPTVCDPHRVRTLTVCDCDADCDPVRLSPHLLKYQRILSLLPLHMRRVLFRGTKSNFFAGQEVFFCWQRVFEILFFVAHKNYFCGLIFFLQFKSTFFAMRPTAQKYSLAAQTYFFLRPKSAVQKYFFRTFGQNALVLQ